jgi:DNA-binding MarR family transcriptional regulator
MIAMQRENLDRNFGFILNDVSRLMRTNFDRRAKSIGLTRSQWWVLTHLYRRDGLVQAELAEILEIERPTLGRLLDRLEAKGWLRREPDPGDRRVKRVYLTDEVKPAMKSLRRIAADLRQEVLEGLNEKERERLVDSLIHLKTNLLNLPVTNKSKA